MPSSFRYKFPNGPRETGWHGPGAKKHGPSPVRPGLARARAWAERSARSAGPGTARSNGRHGAGTVHSRRIAEVGREPLDRWAAGGSGI